MKRILSCILSVLFCVPFQAQDDPVIMKVNGYDVKKSEFEYFFRKNNTSAPVTKKSVREYAELYLNFKLKVQAAVDEGMDKSESFLKEFRTYRDMQAADYMIDTAYLETVARSTYENSVREVGPDGLMLLHLIAITPKEVTDATMREAYAQITEVYDMLEAGQDFGRLALRYSNDSSAKDEGEAGWVSRSQLPAELADEVFSIKEGEYTKPILYDDTFFILKAGPRRDIGTYEDNRDDIMRYLENSTPAVADAMNRKANSYAKRLGWEERDGVAVARLDSLLEEVEPEFGNISREYHDGLLVFDISSREVWDKIGSSTKEMEAYFKAHAQEYKFQEPCFKGMVFFCIDESLFRQVEKALDGLDMSKWADTIVTFNRENVRLRAVRSSSETGIFRKGQNAYVDYVVFGEGEPKTIGSFQYANYVGKILTAPESMQDVASQVAEDYQKYLESQWVKSLRKKYKYKIYKRALKKVSI